MLWSRLVLGSLRLGSHIALGLAALVVPLGSVSNDLPAIGLAVTDLVPEIKFAIAKDFISLISFEFANVMFHATYLNL